MKALYVKIWEPGLHSLAEIQALNSYCAKNGITDIFAQHKVDKATVKRLYDQKLARFDCIASVKAEAVKEAKPPRTHVWHPVLQLYREKNAIDVAPKIPKFTTQGMTYIDPLPEVSRQFIVDKISAYLKDNNAIHLDRFWYPFSYKEGKPEAKREALTDIITRIRSANPTAIISICAHPSGGLDGYNDWQLWLKKGWINRAWIMLNSPTLFDVMLPSVKCVTDSIVVDIKQDLSKCTDMNIALYSYGGR